MAYDRESKPVTSTDANGMDKEESNNLSRNSLKVMTLNAAHGRKDGRHQIFQKNRSIKSNLDDIATVLEQENPDVVALQEADGPSAWSGNFDHVEYLAREANYIYSVRGEHVKGKKLDYGTALLSNLSLNTPVSITFAPSPPTFSKGAVISSINWPGTDMKVDIVSLHLDFARKTVRKKQIDKLVEKLTQRERPLIIMGDFNCEWKNKQSTLGTLMNTLNLKAYRPEAKDMKTFPKTGKRLDWILISHELEFSTYNAFEDTMSDHLGVVSDLRIAESIQN
jgi:endonuclease/exonuclease/phosphatase family metal-dependent hydrolase